MTAIWYLHGFGASAISFTWLKDQLPRKYTSRCFSYAIDDSVESCIDRLTALLDANNEPAILVGHSLGGIIAYACSSSPHVTKLITLCSPFGGIPGVGLLSIFRSPPAFQALRRYSPLLTKMREEPINIPHLAIVSSNGMPVMNTPNDGVVTLASQTALPKQAYYELTLNHYEVLISPDVATIINGFLLEYDLA